MRRLLAALALLVGSCGTSVAAYAQRPAVDTAVTHALGRALLAPPETTFVHDTTVVTRHDTTVLTRTQVDTVRSVHVDTLLITRHVTDTVRVHDTVFVAASAPAPATVPIPAPTSPAAALAGDTASRNLYTRNFALYIDKLWVQYGPGWSNANYYDRAHAYSVVCATGLFGYDRATACQRADTMAVDYRVGYLEGSANQWNACNPSPHQAQMDGLYDHWVRMRVKGDTAQANADVRMFTCAASVFEAFIPSAYLAGQSNGDTRIAARILTTFRLARRIAETQGDTAKASRYAKDETKTIDRLVQWQRADGSFPQAQTCNGDLPYMDGMLGSSLAEMQRDHYDVRADSVIVRIAQFLKTQWRSDSSFNYASVVCANGQPTAAPDLNMDFTRSFMEAYRISGDASFLALADAAFAYGTRKAYLAGTKQFNESYNPDALVYFVQRPTVR